MEKTDSPSLSSLIGVSWVVLAHAFNPRTQEAEAGGALRLRSAWSTEGVPGQLRLHKLLFVTTPLNGISRLCVCVKERES